MSEPANGHAGLETISLLVHPEVSSRIAAQFQVIQEIMPAYARWSALTDIDGPWRRFLWRGHSMPGSRMTFLLSDGAIHVNDPENIGIYGQKDASEHRWKTWALNHSISIRFALYQAGLAPIKTERSVTILTADGAIFFIAPQNEEPQRGIYVPAPTMSGHDLMSAEEKLGALFPDAFRFEDAA